MRQVKEPYSGMGNVLVMGMYCGPREVSILEKAHHRAKQHDQGDSFIIWMSTSLVNLSNDPDMHIRFADNSV